MVFRADINGLRAIAVIAVVLFHFNENILSGGFAGVDVFFVLSGFLMTSIILTSFEKNNFSLIGFYASRARRILPPLLLLCIMLMVLGWFVLTPIDYAVLAKHAASSMSFISNVAYWLEAGYFDGSSKEKWLLHTWSLSAEWQFYLLYPILLLLVKKLCPPKKINYCLLVIFIISFIVGLFITYFQASAAYFLLPSRAWEMLAGGVAFLFPFKANFRHQRFLAYSGLIMIFGSCLFISKENIWPGYLAAIPVIGTCFVIIANRQESIFTNNYVFQYLGKWSYSIYLWHWPIIVALNEFNLLSISYLILGILMSVLMGAASYYFIEKRTWLKERPQGLLQLVFFKPFVISFIACLICIYVVQAEGVWQRDNITPNEQFIFSNVKHSPLRSQCHTGGNQYLKPSEACHYFSSQSSWAIFGDSHAVELAYGLAKELKKHNDGVEHYSFSDCPPSYNSRSKNQYCDNWSNETINYINTKDSIENVVISYRYSYALFGENGIQPVDENKTDIDYRKKILNSLDQIIKTFSATKKHVYVILPIPELLQSIDNQLAEHYYKNQPLDNLKAIELKYYLDRNKIIMTHFLNQIYSENVTFVKVKDIFCDNRDCFSVKNGIPLYFDNDHPSILAAEAIAGKVLYKN